jgi:soluble lytic murein transglycosylase
MSFRNIKRIGIGVLLTLCVGLAIAGVVQFFALKYLLEENFQKRMELWEQRQKIAEMEEKLQIFHVIDDFQSGFDQKEKGLLTSVIYDESKKYGFDPFLIMALILSESSFKKYQESEMGAQGLLQIKPSLANDLAQRMDWEWKGEFTLFDPAFNIKVGILHLFELFLKYKDLKKALVAYNMGENALQLKLESGQPLPAYFVNKVLKNYQSLKHKYLKASVDES